MSVSTRQISTRVLLAAVLVIGASTFTTAQVVQERTHNIEQSGSGAPVVSITSDERTVRSTRDVTIEEGTTRTTHTRTGTARQTRDTHSDSVADSPPVRSVQTDQMQRRTTSREATGPQPQVSQGDAAQEQERSVSRAELRQMCAPIHPPTYYQARGLSPDICDRIGAGATVRPQEDVMRSDARVPSEEQVVPERTQRRVTSRQEVRQSADETFIERVTIYVREVFRQRSQEDARITTGERQVRTSSSESPAMAGVSVRPTDGARQVGQGQGCSAHAHSHGWETHHGEYHVGGHTHSHTHCR